jgi:riboflavin kinase/FMN adenylyltransferase
MRIFSTIDDITEVFPIPILTMGNFDGVHVGHQSVFRLVQQRAQQLHGTSLVLTFDPHPQKILYPEKEFYLINHISEKINIIRDIGIDVLFCIAFTKTFAAQDPEDFVRDVLVDKLRVKEVYVGYDSRFGQGERGSPDKLKTWGRKYDFRTIVVSPITHHGIVISSTKIRQLIRQGQVEQAAQMLNRPYAVDGRVVSGAHRGATLLGCPTANIEVLHELIPKNGVYISHVVWKNHTYQAVVNVGTNPTFHAQHITVEAHLLDFEGDLYGERIKALFLARIRDEVAYPTPEALAAQIAQDILAAKAYFDHHESWVE